MPRAQVESFLSRYCKIVSDPEDADVLFTEWGGLIALRFKNDREEKFGLFVAPDATRCTWENRREVILGKWEVLPALVKGKKAFDLGEPISRDNNCFIPRNATAEIKKRIPLLVPA